MKNEIRLRDKSILETDFSVGDKAMQKWHEKREKRGQVYQAFSQCILYLEELLECENDSFEKRLIEKEIKKLRKKQQNYRVPSILEMSVYRINSVPRKDSLEKSSFSLVKNRKKV